MSKNCYGFWNSVLKDTDPLIFFGLILREKGFISKKGKESIQFTLTFPSYIFIVHGSVLYKDIKIKPYVVCRAILSVPFS